MVNCLRDISEDRDIRPTNFAGQVSLPADGEYAHLLTLGYDEDNGQKFETLLGSVSL